MSSFGLTHLPHPTSLVSQMSTPSCGARRKKKGRDKSRDKKHHDRGFRYSVARSVRIAAARRFPFPFPEHTRAFDDCGGIRTHGLE